MQLRILFNLSVSAILAFMLALWAYRSGAGALAAVMIYGFGGSLLTVVIAAVQVVLEPVVVPDAMASSGSGDGVGPRGGERSSVAGHVMHGAGAGAEPIGAARVAAPAREHV